MKLACMGSSGKKNCAKGTAKRKHFMYSPAVSNGTWGEKIQPHAFKNSQRASSVFKEQ